MTTDKETIRQQVRAHYGKVAGMDTFEASASQGPSCCSPVIQDSMENAATSCCSKDVPAGLVSKALGYSDQDLAAIPEGSNMGLGCGNPNAIASLKPGETVLDLGSGGGFDCFLASREVGETGRVIGVDMTPDMVAKARQNQEKSNAGNISFRLGEIEHLPVADASIDCIMSNCVINLSPDKQQVFDDALRVLKPGGRLAISDVVALAPLPDDLKNDTAMVSACVGGAETIENLKRMLRQSGFMNVDIRMDDDSHEFIKTWVPGSKIEDYVVSATIQAEKPVKGAV